jgi:tetratricopeptide (TPR) repeat protein
MARPNFTLASICICWALLGASPSHAQLADQPGRACNQDIVTLDDAIAACSAVIDSGRLSGRPLAEAYAQRGFHRTARRSLTEAEADLDEAIKIDPDYAQAYSNRAQIFGT